MNSTDLDEQVKKTLRVARTNKWIEAVVLIVFGLVLFIWSDTAMLLVCKMIAVVIAAVGFIAVVAYLFGRNNVYGSPVGLFAGVLGAVIGLYLFYYPDILIELGPTIIGLIILVTGFVDLSEATHIEKQQSGGTTAALVIAAIEIILGVIFILHPGFLSAILFKLMAFCLILDGVADIWMVFQIGKVKKVAEDIAAVAQGDFVDADVRPLHEEEAKEEPKKQSFVERAKARATQKRQQKEASAAEGEAPAAEPATEEVKDATGEVDGYTTISHHSAEMNNVDDIAEEIPPQ